MKLYNTLSRKIEELKPIKSGQVSVYTCGPTVYDHVHLGNWRAFVFADTLRRTLILSGLELKSVMNVTDVDDKTIHRAVKEKVELADVTRRYEKIYLAETAKLGINMSLTKVVRATDELDSMRQLILQIHQQGIAYVADDGVYFSVSKYQDKHPYGVLSNVAVNPSQSQHRINNDDYDKEDARDFALWKKSDPGEPSWDLEIDGQTIAGRPGWHIECSAMSEKYLGQPFDIHTGGIDLTFPHHENEIAQSRAANGRELANIFNHNEHLLVNGKKMSKSLGNFYTLVEIEEKGFDPLALRLLFLQSHYRSQQNFTWEALEAAQNFLQKLQAFADRRHQDDREGKPGPDTVKQNIIKHLANDLDTPQALAELSGAIDESDQVIFVSSELQQLLDFLDKAFGLGLADRPDIDKNTKQMIVDREHARSAKDYTKSDQIRTQLAAKGIEVEDTPNGPRWHRVKT